MYDALIAGEKSKDETDNLTKKFYQEIDKNQDGKISKKELT